MTAVDTLTYTENEIRRIFNEGIAEIRKLEAEAQKVVEYFNENHQQLVESVETIVENIKAKEA